MNAFPSEEARVGEIWFTATYFNNNNDPESGDLDGAVAYCNGNAQLFHFNVFIK